MKKKNWFCLVLWICSFIPCYSQQLVACKLPYTVLSEEEWQVLEESIDESHFVYRAESRGNLKDIPGLVLNPDSIRMMIQDEVEILWNRYDWMPEDKEYVYGLILSNGMKLSFMQISYLIGYDAKEKVLFLGYYPGIYFAIDLKTGWDKPLARDCYPSLNGHQRVIYQYYRSNFDAPFMIQQYQEESGLFYDLCSMSDFKTMEYNQLYRFCWINNTLLIHFTDNESKNRYIQINFEKK
ncbi:MAG: hypothetical protein LUH10_09875 [Tannerellaceae bacterium]|nr:hypothetical protein [Tannerellaceae bacterium]